MDTTKRIESIIPMFPQLFGADLRCECGNPLARNVRHELITGMCDECIKNDPDEFEERWENAQTDEARDAQVG